MTPRSPLWREFEVGDSLLPLALRIVVLFFGILFLCFTATLPLTWPQQLLVAVSLLFLAVWLDRSSDSYLVTLTLMLLSIFSTFRYAFWRVSSVAGYLHDSGNRWAGPNAFFIGLLLLAECYAFLVLLLGYLQTVWPLRRTPVPLPEDTADWPSVDLLIPTFDEPLGLVRFTALAAMNIDWPADKLNVYLLDDGRREDFRAFAEEAGLEYITRENNLHAKAGNINHALQRLNSPFVAIFDSDHVPTRSFLQVTMGWFLRDTKLCMMQTPHHLYSPDPFERNLNQFRILPNEGELFYGIVQDGNDFWNATSFCGSCAVIRRQALDEVGGFAVETVTEDAHTSLRMQRNGWNTAYLNIPQAAGLATLRLSGHVKQRIRWARGMVQILRIENPLFAPGLTAAQRLCYFTAMSHFLYALPRLIFLTAPLIYLLFGATNIPGFWASILAYAIPHLVLSKMTNSRVQGQHRHSFWNEIYETVLAPYILLPTFFALLSPKRGRFNVTAKSDVFNGEFFDARIARPTLVLLGFNLFGLLCAIPRLIRFPSWNVPQQVSWLVSWPASLYDGGHAGTIGMNVIWSLFNVMILGVASAVARESQQRRQTVRVAMAVPTDVILADESMIQGTTSDLSSGGVRTRMEHALKAEAGDAIRFVFPVLDGTATLPATIVERDGQILRARFDPLNLQQQEALTMILYSRADTWLGWGEAREADRPLLSMARIIRLSLRGIVHVIQTLTVAGTARLARPKGTMVGKVAPIAVLAALGGYATGVAPALQPKRAAARTAMQAPAGKSFHTVFTLSDVGVTEAIVLRGIEARHSIYFTLPQSQVVKSATMQLKDRSSPGLLPGMSHLNVSLNGSLIATLPVTHLPNGNISSDGATVNLPANLLVHHNQLTFLSTGHYAQCDDPSNTAPWTQIEANSTIELSGSVLPLPNDLNLLPVPFYEAGVDPHPMVPIVFLSPPSAMAIQAAGIIASSFGVLAGDQPVRFPVSVGKLPPDNAVVIAESFPTTPTALNFPAGSGSTIALRTNPFDTHRKLLIVSGANGDDLLRAARALPLHGDLWQGADVTLRNLTMPAPRQPDDAPRWLSTARDKQSSLGDVAQTADLDGDGSVPFGLSLRLPPDLDYGQMQNVPFHLRYSYNAIPLGKDNMLQVSANSTFVSSTPMPHTEKTTEALDTVVPIPVGDMRPFSNSISMTFALLTARAGACSGTAPQNLRGEVLKGSYLDISGIRHWAVLPNLELFANAGYPFTRKADLASTTVVLPDQPAPEELELFLTLMGHFGAQTGYPVLNVTVTDASGMDARSGKDYLVMGTALDQPALATLAAALPVTFSGPRLHLRDTGSFFAHAAWWRVPSSEQVQPGELETTGGLPDALVEGIEWPRGSHRSLVVMVLRDSAAIPNFLAAFLRSSQTSDLSQSVSVLHGETFTSYRMGTDRYGVGEISAYMRLVMMLQTFPWLIPISAVILCLLIATLLRAMLRRRARVRLQSI